MTSGNRGALIFCLFAAALLPAVIVTAISIGSHPIHPARTLTILGQHILIAVGAQPESALAGSLAQEDAIIWHVRAPRVLVAAFVGAALAFSGAIMQGLFRNPLASPGILHLNFAELFAVLTPVSTTR
ncbi:MAG: iron ABC transporter permease [Fuerstiella sp.]|nr:iron ABC transporter permease [Fuerstiella sp.]MCP4857788.1 iron ABC transporter permease [Fuerstiella sp.]